jgi:hypothetical protein
MCLQVFLSNTVAADGLCVAHEARAGVRFSNCHRNLYWPHQETPQTSMETWRAELLTLESSGTLASCSTYQGDRRFWAKFDFHILGGVGFFDNSNGKEIPMDHLYMQIHWAQTVLIRGT